jgi:hypothetical protein
VRRAAIAGLLLAACTRPPPSPVSPGDQHTYDELVECGALAASDGGPQAVAQERAIGDMPFLACMYDGGSPTACGAPCTVTP